MVVTDVVMAFILNLKTGPRNTTKRIGGLWPDWRATGSATVCTWLIIDICILFACRFIQTSGWSWPFIFPQWVPVESPVEYCRDWWHDKLQQDCSRLIVDVWLIMLRISNISNMRAPLILLDILSMWCDSQMFCYFMLVFVPLFYFIEFISLLSGFTEL